MADRGRDRRRRPTLLSDEELRRRVMADPDVRARLKEVLQHVKDGGSEDPGLGPDALREFLREYEQGLDPR
jgi:hypothetical protein